MPLNRKDLISSPSQDQLPGLNIYLSVFQAGDTANYGSNSHGYREELSELGSQSSDQEGPERKNAPNILRGNSRVVKGPAFSAGMPLYLAFENLETSFSLTSLFNSCVKNPPTFFFFRNGI